MSIARLRTEMSNTENHQEKQIEKDGYAIEHAVFRKSVVERLRGEMISLTQGSSPAGKRNLLRISSLIAQTATGPDLRSVLVDILGETFFPVRAIFFDKTPDTNWPVLWHQDLSIAVQEKIELEGFGPWSIKNNIQHVQPPASILDHMLTARIHLDTADEENGALKVIPGSHSMGLMSRQEIERLTAIGQAVTCRADARDVLLMRPLLLHSSSRSNHPMHRRVIHIENCNTVLPSPLKWHETQ